MNIPFDSKNNGIARQNATRAAQTFGAQTTGKAEEADPRHLEDEILTAKEREKDIVKLTEKEGQRAAQQYGIQDEKKSKEKEIRQKSEYLGRDAFSAVDVDKNGGELHISPKEKLEEVTEKKPEAITKGLPPEVEKASRIIVEKQIDPDTQKVNGSLKEVQAVEETREIEESMEQLEGIADIHDKSNDPVPIEV